MQLTKCMWEHRDSSIPVCGHIPRMEANVSSMDQVLYTLVDGTGECTSFCVWGPILCPIQSNPVQSYST